MKEYRKQICRLLDNGISNMAEIGRQVGCSRENVRQLLTDSGHYKNGCRLDRNKAFILELRDRGYTQREVAKAIGCSEQSVNAALKRWGAGRGRVKRAQKQYEERRIVCRKEM
jgi:DNA-binding CsgD family transcriptional regulator